MDVKTREVLWSGGERDGTALSPPRMPKRALFAQYSVRPSGLTRLTNQPDRLLSSLNAHAHTFPNLSIKIPCMITSQIFCNI